ncbi:glycosyltransferase [Nonlabens ulvanivorans]|uniref:glycosyltransferase n=1 Tax=Nonlabens ulvanivorans TaxID=906888 RepID=UPI0029428C5D|nr:glycosyltransferase [Nonlabens ulvanivorans]WOI22393.1 glycosyltransferase [Nonlabens ulvanivorans]
MLKPLVIIQTVVPSYRIKVFDEIQKQLKDGFKIYCGDSFFDSTIKTSINFKSTGTLKNHYILGRRFLWQTGHWNEVFKDNVLVLSLNPRVISHWIILLLRLLSRKRTILWGHAWPRSGQNSKSDKLRHLMRFFASEIIVYTEQQRRELQEKMAYKKITTAPNAVLYRHEMSSETDNEVNDVIYVGRLIEDKKPLLLYQGFKNALDSLPEKAKLIIIGDGPQRLKLVELSKKDDLEHRVTIPGKITDIDVLKSYYSKALVSASPGYVGLSITQSLGYGVPMIIARDEHHSPELEAAKEDFNAQFFNSDDENNLAQGLVLFFNEKDKWLNRRTEIVEYCKNTYSIEIMTRAFVNLVKV